jgi:hypothetical protein
VEPRVDHFVYRTNDKPFDQSQVQILANTALDLSVFHDFGNDIEIHLRHLPDLLLGPAGETVGFGLVDDSQIPVTLKFFKVPSDEVFQLLDGAAPAIDFFSEALENLLGFVFEKLNQDIVLVFEVQIDGPIGHTSLSGDFGNGRLMISVAGKHLDGRLENAVVFIVFFAVTDGSIPLDRKNYE